MMVYGTYHTLGADPREALSVVALEWVWEGELGSQKGKGSYLG